MWQNRMDSGPFWQSKKGRESLCFGTTSIKQDIWHLDIDLSVDDTGPLWRATWAWDRSWPRLSSGEYWGFHSCLHNTSLLSLSLSFYSSFLHTSVWLLSRMEKSPRWKSRQNLEGTWKMMWPSWNLFLCKDRHCCHENTSSWWLFFSGR